MLVKDIMTEPVVTIREDQSILEAREIMRGKRLISQQFLVMLPMVILTSWSAICRAAYIV